jgi:hypothetical protein
VAAIFEQRGTAFEYPENWQIDEDEVRDAANAVTVYSPGGAFWSVRYEDAQVEPRELVQAALSAMQQEYDELDAEPVAEIVEDEELVGVDMNFYCLDLTNTAQVRSLRTRRGTCLIMWQAEDGEFERLEPVFRAITTSLLRRC